MPIKFIDKERENMISFFNKKILINNKYVGDNHPSYIIAEAGVAHFGDINKALKLVDLAVEAKADAVKFQIYDTENFISAESLEWVEKYKSKELPKEAFREIQAYCKECGIEFLATAHEEKSLEFLDKIGVPAYKIGSGEVKNWPFIKEVANRNLPVILSTGMYSFDDIKKVIEIFSKVGNKNLILLHCVTSYPTPFSDVNLRVMNTIKESFNVITGYSDHTSGYNIPLAAIACGACVLEKHISIDFNVPNAQDWKVSCDLDNMKKMVKDIRDIELSFGTGEKVLSENEQNCIEWARKSIVAKNDIPKFKLISKNDLIIKRPGWGISPSKLNNVIGRKSKKNITKDSLIKWEFLD